MEYQEGERKYYRGQWKNGLKHGKGRDVYDGEANYYEGHFDNGLRDGHGILRLPEKNYSYDGHWSRDKMDGQGFVKYSDGSSYNGQFKENAFNGKVIPLFLDHHT